VLAAAWFTAAATLLLAGLAVVTAIFAIKAFGKQAQEVRDQAGMLEVQSGQLETMRGQLAEMQKVSQSQLEVLSLQADELRESLSERERDTRERHRAQAARVFISLERSAAHKVPDGVIGVDHLASVEATVHNASEQPVYDVELGWYKGSAPEGDPGLLGVIMPGGAMRGGGSFPRGQSLTAAARS
jgi:predicted PhzF superfamily epimerase YddE/YHI9